MLIFCTLFNTGYISRGLLMHESLRRTCPSFRLYVVPLDETTERVLTALALPSVVILPLRDIENDALLAVKPGRTMPEYSWTLKSPAAIHIIERLGEPHCIYLDADLYFYNDPTSLLAELGEDSVGVAEHHCTPENDISHVAGKYCMQFLAFRNDQRGLDVLHWWRDACVEWCFDRAEPGRYGDQKYSDEWPRLFGGIHSLPFPPWGVAPWNIQQFRVTMSDGRPRVTELATGRTSDMIFFHFHYVRFYGDGMLELGDYRLPDDAVTLLYFPYLRELERMKELALSVEPGIQPHGIARKTGGWKRPLILLKRRYRGRYNIIPESRVFGDRSISRP